jgi:hypothetical protein
VVSEADTSVNTLIGVVKLGATGFVVVATLQPVDKNDANKAMLARMI